MVLTRFLMSLALEFISETQGIGPHSLQVLPWERDMPVGKAGELPTNVKRLLFLFSF